MFNTDLLLLIGTELISVLPVQVVRNEERRLSDRLSLWTVYQDAKPERSSMFLC